MPVSKRVQRIGISSTMKVAAKAKELKSQGVNVIDLSVGEPDFPTPANIKEAAIRAIENNNTKYTVNVGLPELREAITSKLKRENDLDYSVNDIVVSSGAKQCIYNAIQTLVYHGDEVIIPAPYWVSYPHMVSMAHGESVIVETTQENGFKITPEQLEEAITPYTKVLILCNPSNPTGSAYTRDELEKIAEITMEHNVYVISDEIYEKLIYDDFKYTSFASLGDKVKERTVLVNGVSKAYAMTGWRIGYVAASHDVIQGINKVQSHSTSNASSISQHAAIEALSGPQDQVEFMRGEFEKRRNYFLAELNKIDGITCRKPEGAFYLFPDISGLYHKSNEVLRIESSFDFSMYLLNEAKLAAVPGSSFGAEGFMRMSYATSMEVLEEAVVRIKAVVDCLK